MEEADLPKALIKRIIKNKLSRFERPKEGEERKEIQLNKDALLAFAEGAKVFISYLTAVANDICKEHKRQTVSADDVLKALSDIDLDELVEPLKESLAAFKLEFKDKSKKKAELTRKRKAEKAASQAEAGQQQSEKKAKPGEDGEEEGGDEGADEDEENADEHEDGHGMPDAALAPTSAAVPNAMFGNSAQGLQMQNGLPNTMPEGQPAAG